MTTVRVGWRQSGSGSIHIIGAPRFFWTGAPLGVNPALLKDNASPIAKFSCEFMMLCWDSNFYLYGQWRIRAYLVCQYRLPLLFTSRSAAVSSRVKTYRLYTKAKWWIDAEETDDSATRRHGGIGNEKTRQRFVSLSHIPRRQRDISDRRTVTDLRMCSRGVGERERRKNGYGRDS